jgi:hypothetical protein
MYGLKPVPFKLKVYPSIDPLLAKDAEGASNVSLKIGILE